MRITIYANDQLGSSLRVANLSYLMTARSSHEALSSWIHQNRQARGQRLLSNGLRRKSGPIEAIKTVQHPTQCVWHQAQRFADIGTHTDESPIKSPLSMHSTILILKTQQLIVINQTSFTQMRSCRTCSRPLRPRLRHRGTPANREKQHQVCTLEVRPQIRLYPNRARQIHISFMVCNSRECACMACRPNSAVK